MEFGRISSPTPVQYHRVDLAGPFYLWSRSSAERLLELRRARQGSDEIPQLAISTTVLAALAVEGMANEVAESLFADEELRDFDTLSGRFSRCFRTLPSTLRKLLIIRAVRRHVAAPEPVEFRSRVTELLRARNLLVHYHPKKAARRVIFEAPPDLASRIADGMFPLWDYAWPHRVEDGPVVELLVTSKPIAHSNTALQVIRFLRDAMAGPMDDLPDPLELD
jgi:hypothetical protein